MDHNQLGKAIRILRQAKSQTIGELAEGAEVSKPYISLVESGDRQPSIAVIQRIAATLKVPMEVLLAMATPEAMVKTTGSARKLSNAIETLINVESELTELLGKESQLANQGRAT